jgi:hypothetical protein
VVGKRSRRVRRSVELARWRWSGRARARASSAPAARSPGARAASSTAAAIGGPACRRRGARTRPGRRRWSGSTKSAQDGALGHRWQCPRLLACWRTPASSAAAAIGDPAAQPPPGVHHPTLLPGEPRKRSRSCRAFRRENGARQVRRCSLPIGVLGTTGGDQADRTDRHAELLATARRIVTSNKTSGATRRRLVRPAGTAISKITSLRGYAGETRPPRCVASRVSNRRAGVRRRCPEKARGTRRACSPPLPPASTSAARPGLVLVEQVARGARPRLPRQSPTARDPRRVARRRRFVT